VPGKFPLGSVSGIGSVEHATDFYNRTYEQHKDSGPAFGVYYMAKPLLVLTDPDLVKAILATYFETFHERGFTVSKEADPLSQHLFFLSGQKWKDAKAKLSQTFTSGKMKMMLPTVVDPGDPERFRSENAQNRHSFVFLPFSEGPRQCVGMRFGLMQVKIAIVKLLINFKFLPSSKTSKPMKFKPNAVLQSPLNGVWLKLERL
jgi:cytochrome P450